MTNILGLHTAMFKDKLLHWSSNCSPFMLLIAFAIFNIGRNLKFKSKIVNYVSGLSLLIYIIHENPFVKTYIRPYLWQCIYDTVGYVYILCWALLLALVVFIVSLVLSILYKSTVQRLITYLVPKLYELICSIYKKYELLIKKLN